MGPLRPLQIPPLDARGDEWLEVRGLPWRERVYVLDPADFTVVNVPEDRYLY